MRKKYQITQNNSNNYTIIFLITIIILLLIFIFFNKNNNPISKLNYIYSNNLNLENYKKNNLECSNNKNNNDILLNPYSPPLRDDRIFNNDNTISRIPINQSTQSFDTTYRQIGILTRENGPETILPLMGRPLFSNRDKWNFYTMNDKNNMIKLPITFKNKSCTNDQGCDNLYNGDTVYVEGYNDLFKVTIYDNNVMKYIPYL